MCHVAMLYICVLYMLCMVCICVCRYVLCMCVVYACLCMCVLCLYVCRYVLYVCFMGKRCGSVADFLCSMCQDLNTLLNLICNPGRVSNHSNPFASSS